MLDKVALVCKAGLREITELLGTVALEEGFVTAHPKSEVHPLNNIVVHLEIPRR